MENILFHIKYILVKWVTIIGKILMDQRTKKDGGEICSSRQSFEDYIGFAIKRLYPVNQCKNGLIFWTYLTNRE